MCCLVFKMISFNLSIEALILANLAILAEKFVNAADFDSASSCLLDIV